MTFAVIRIRGSVNINADVKDTLRMLRLNRVNHCAIVPENDAYKGMIQKVKDYVTWGEVDKEALGDALKLFGRLEGQQKLEESYLKENTPFKTIDEFAAAVAEGKTPLAATKNIKPILRLHPPKKGYEGIKRPFSLGGALGYRGNKINDLVKRMCVPAKAVKTDAKMAKVAKKPRK